MITNLQKNVSQTYSADSHHSNKHNTQIDLAPKTQNHQISCQLQPEKQLELSVQNNQRKVLPTTETGTKILIFSVFGAGLMYMIPVIRKQKNWVIFIGLLQLIGNSKYTVIKPIIGVTGLVCGWLFWKCRAARAKTPLQKAQASFQLLAAHTTKKQINWVYNARRKYYQKFAGEHKFYARKLQQLEEHYRVLMQAVEAREKGGLMNEEGGMRNEEGGMKNEE